MVDLLPLTLNLYRDNSRSCQFNTRKLPLCYTIWLSWGNFVDLVQMRRSPLQTRLPPVSQCRRSPHLVNGGDARVPSTHDGVEDDKIKCSTVLDVEQPGRPVRFPESPILRPLSPELARKEVIRRKTVKNVIPKRFTPQMVAHLAGTTVFDLEKVVRLEVRKFCWLWSASS